MRIKFYLAKYFSMIEEIPMAKKISFIMASIVAMTMGLTACGEEKSAQKPTEEIAAEQGEIARANNPAPTAKEPATEVVAPAPAPTTNTGEISADAGEKVYQATCKTCHEAGLLGAPKTGDKANWEPRIAQGKDILYKHAIEGFTGKSGTMPPKGGSTAPDAEIKAAVDYMITKS